jgi:Mrp family chromosome partitioning ATPase
MSMTSERNRRFRRSREGDGHVDSDDGTDGGVRPSDSSQHSAEDDETTTGDVEGAGVEGAGAEGGAAEGGAAEGGGTIAIRLPAKPARKRSSRRPPATLTYEDIPVEIAEALRGIINRSELRAGHPLPQAIAVTAAVRGEGVTTLSRSLAALIASEMGRFVCWIDCSWLSGDPSHEQGDRPSLIDILADDSQMENAFESTPEQPSLVSLSPGPVPESQRNLIARSPEFEHMLGLLKDEFDHLIFDLPPILTHANAIGLLRQADAGILVVRHRSTSIAHVERTVEAMHPTPNLAVVLNQYRSSIPKRIERLLGA